MAGMKRTHGRALKSKNKQPPPGAWTKAGMAGVPRGPLSWESVSPDAPRTRVAMVDGKVVATIHAPPSNRGNWAVTIPGWRWHVPLNGTSAPDRRTVEETDVMNFPTLRRAKVAVAEAFALLDAHGLGP